MRRWIVRLLVAAGLVAPALAADLRVRPDRAKPVNAPHHNIGTPEENVFVRPDSTCLSWTDNCRICTLVRGAEVACSNVAIACEAKPIRCTARQ